MTGMHPPAFLELSKETVGAMDGWIYNLFDFFYLSLLKIVYVQISQPT